MKRNELAVRNTFVTEKKKYNTIASRIEIDRDSDLSALLARVLPPVISDIVLQFMADPLQKMRNEMFLRCQIGDRIVGECSFYMYKGIVLKDKLFVFSDKMSPVSFTTANTYIFRVNVTDDEFLFI